MIGEMGTVRIVHGNDIGHHGRYLNAVVIGHRAGSTRRFDQEAAVADIGDTNMLGRNRAVTRRRGGEMQQRRLFHHAKQAGGQGGLGDNPDNNSGGQCKQPGHHSARFPPRPILKTCHCVLPRPMDTGDIVTELESDYQQMTRGCRRIDAFRSGASFVTKCHKNLRLICKRLWTTDG